MELTLPLEGSPVSRPVQPGAARRRANVLEGKEWIRLDDRQTSVRYSRMDCPNLPARTPLSRGMVVGRLTLLEVVGRQSGGVLWRCRCACGTLCNIRASKLRSTTRSCGCHWWEQLAERNRERARQVQYSRSKNNPLYRVYHGMRDRCENPRNRAFPDYGGRGIAVCDRWRRSFAAFCKDVDLAPSRRHSIGRIDNDKGYEPGNVQWETAAQQARNRRNNHYLQAHGQEKTIGDWASGLGTSSTTIRRRIESGWTVEAAVTVPVQPRRQKEEA